MTSRFSSWTLEALGGGILILGLILAVLALWRVIVFLLEAVAALVVFLGRGARRSPREPDLPDPVPTPDPVPPGKVLVNKDRARILEERMTGSLRDTAGNREARRKMGLR